MSIEIIHNGNIFESKCQTLVNPVNCVGVMRKGLALEFKQRWPEMFLHYKMRCDSRNPLTVGNPELYKINDKKQILLFPTKGHWKEPSRLDWIVNGLHYFTQFFKTGEVTSIAFPALGCGNGGLPWELIRPVMIHYLCRLKVPIEIYAFRGRI